MSSISSMPSTSSPSSFSSLSSSNSQISSSSSRPLHSLVQVVKDSLSLYSISSSSLPPSLSSLSNPTNDEAAAQIIERLNCDDNIEDEWDKIPSKVLDCLGRRFYEIKSFSYGWNHLIVDTILERMVKQKPIEAFDIIAKYINDSKFPGFLFYPKYADLLKKLASEITTAHFHLPSLKYRYKDDRKFSFSCENICDFISRFRNLKALHICLNTHVDIIHIHNTRLRTLNLNIEGTNVRAIRIDSRLIKTVHLTESDKLQTITMYPSRPAIVTIQAKKTLPEIMTKKYYTIALLNNEFGQMLKIGLPKAIVNNPSSSLSSPSSTVVSP